MLVASGSSLSAVTGPRTWGSADTESCSPNILTRDSQGYIVVHIQAKHLDVKYISNGYNVANRQDYQTKHKVSMFLKNQIDAQGKNHA